MPTDRQGAEGADPQTQLQELHQAVAAEGPAAGSPRVGLHLTGFATWLDTVTITEHIR